MVLNKNFLCVIKLLTLFGPGQPQLAVVIEKSSIALCLALWLAGLGQVRG